MQRPAKSKPARRNGEQSEPPTKCQESLKKPMSSNAAVATQHRERPLPRQSLRRLRLAKPWSHEQRARLQSTNGQPGLKRYRLSAVDDTSFIRDYATRDRRKIAASSDGRGSPSSRGRQRTGPERQEWVRQ